MEFLERMAEEVLNLERVWYHKLKAEKFVELPAELPKDRRMWRSFTIFYVMNTYKRECQLTGITPEELKSYLKKNGARMTAERKAKEAATAKLNLSLYSKGEIPMARTKKSKVSEIVVEELSEGLGGSFHTTDIMEEETIEVVEETVIETPIVNTKSRLASDTHIVPECKMLRMFRMIFNNNINLGSHKDVTKGCTNPYYSLTAAAKAAKIAANNGVELYARTWVKSTIGGVETLLIEHDKTRTSQFSRLVNEGWNIANLCVGGEWKTNIVLFQTPDADSVYFIEKKTFWTTFYKGWTDANSAYFTDENFGS